MICKIIQTLSSLDLRLYLFSINKSPLRCGDKVYIKERMKGIKSYSLMTIKGLQYCDGMSEFHLVDENNGDFYCNIEKVYPFKGQDLKKQKIYDIVSHTIIFVLLAGATAFFCLNPNLSEYALYNFKNKF